MQRHSTPPPPATPERPDPALDDALPIDQVTGEAIPSPVPPVETALDDDEGGAEPVDPETGRPYDETDPGTATLPSDRRGGTSET